MTAEEKALELVERFLSLDMYDYEDYVYWLEKENAKRCALICVDEILEFAYNIEWEKKEEAISKLKFLKEVKQEINKL